MLQTVENEMQRSAIETIFKMYYGKMVGVAMRVLQNESDAEDAVMDTFRYICQNPSLFENYPSSKTVALVFICTKSRAIDIYRRKQQDNNTCYVSADDDGEIDVIDSSADVEAFFANQEKMALLSQAIQSLEEMYRFPIILKYFYNMRNAEIAAMLKIDDNIVNGRIFRAKKKLRSMLKEKEFFL